MTTNPIHPIAICILRSDGSVLVGHAFDSKKNEYYCRPPGGGVEFGERAEDALRRELREELGAEIEDVQLMSVIENRFELEGTPGHEIVRLRGVFHGSQVARNSKNPHGRWRLGRRGHLGAAVAV